MTLLEKRLVNAAEKGRLGTVKALLKLGVDLHYVDDFALRAAAENGRTETVKLLLDKGADVNTLFGAPLRNAAQNDHIETMRLLLDRGADIHIFNDSALRQAAWRGCVKAVQLLVDRGADIHARDDLNAYPDAPLTSALMRDREDVVQLLLSKGAKVYAQNDNNLRYACKNGRFDLVEIYLEHIFAASAWQDSTLAQLDAKKQSLIARLEKSTETDCPIDPVYLRLACNAIDKHMQVAFHAIRREQILRNPLKVRPPIRPRPL